MDKNWYKSKTLWVNALVILGAVFTDLAGVLGTGGTISVVAIANLILRAVTKSGIAWK
jgi:hypothetical protein|tara:strand:- start:125 stop:298 length:174 start_codon:yes stop_codon:yes gene_type:complete